MRGFRQKEAQLFFRVVSRMRQGATGAPWSFPHSAEADELLDDIQVIALHTESQRLRERCYDVMQEFGTTALRRPLPARV